MCPYDQIYMTCLESFFDVFFVLGCERSGEDLDPNTQREQELGETVVMLRREDRQWSEQCRLSAKLFDDMVGNRCSDDRLTRSHISLEQTHHRTTIVDIIDTFFDRSFLCPCKLKRQCSEKLCDIGSIWFCYGRV